MQVGQLASIKLLLSRPGVCVNAKDSAGQTPLYRAAHQGYEDVVRLLLSRRADKGRANARGERPADVVCRGGNHQNAHAIAALLR